MSAYWISIATPILIDLIAVMGLFIVARTGRISVGHAAFMTMGGYSSGLVSIHLGWPLPLALLAGVVFTAVVAAVFGALISRLGDWFFAIATLAIGFVAEDVLSNSEFLGGALGLLGIPLKVVDLWPMLWCFLLVLVVVLGLEYAVPLGLRMRAVRDSAVTAAAAGINVFRVRLVGFVIGSAIAGLAGGLQAHYLTFAQPSDASFGRSFTYLAFLAIGGSDIWLGPVFGAALLSILPEMLRFSSTWRLAIYGGLLALVMILRPEGLLPASTFRTVRALGRRVTGGPRTKKLPAVD